MVLPDSLCTGCLNYDGNQTIRGELLKWHTQKSVLFVVVLELLLTQSLVDQLLHKQLNHVTDVEEVGG